MLLQSLHLPRNFPRLLLLNNTWPLAWQHTLACSQAAPCVLDPPFGGFGIF